MAKNICNQGIKELTKVRSIKKPNRTPNYTPNHTQSRPLSTPTKASTPAPSSASPMGDSGEPRFPAKVEIGFERVKNAILAPLPKYKTPGSAGMDLHAALDKPIVLPKRSTRLIPTGLRMAIPAGYEAQVRPRSGLALKHSVTVLNSPGTVDSDYRGELKVILTNFGEEDFEVKPMDRIAQVVIAPYVRGVLVEREIDGTQRGQGGFGSTGV